MIFLGREIGEQRDYSESVAETIDEEVHEIVSTAYERALGVLRENRDKLDALAELLIEVETVGREEFLEVMGERPSGPASEPPSEPAESGANEEGKQPDSDRPPAPLGTAPSPA